jgi:hypothetical protein
MLRFFFLPLLFLSLVSPAISQSLTLTDRIQAQEKIERIYYNHRIWPESNKSPKPSFEEMMPRSVIEKKVNDSLSLQITPKMLQAEMDRIAKTTKDPEMLQELFSALNNDPHLIAETLVRPILAQRINYGESFVPTEKRMKNFRLSTINTDSHCEGWEVLDANNPPLPRAGHTAVWTGAEMIIWGGGWNTGGRYDPTLNIWTATSTGANVPEARGGNTAIWTGTEMIIWGGYKFQNGGFQVINTGGRYNPITDTWATTSLGTNVPSGRTGHTAVWTGSQMIVWGGGYFDEDVTQDGGRYDPSTDSWQPTSIGANVPDGRSYHSAIWTGQEMIIWGGFDYYGGIYGFNSGARYDPASDSWIFTSLVNAPLGRYAHTAVWTGNEMIVWGGYLSLLYDGTNTGAKYDPITDTWQPTSLIGATFYKVGFTAVWTGSEMIVWGGNTSYAYYDLYTQTGARYSPANDTWLGTAIGPNTPSKRSYHSAVWTGTKMIVFGGTVDEFGYLDSGGIYSSENDNIQVSPPTLPMGEVGTFYNQTISPSGGNSPYNFALVQTHAQVAIIIIF